MCGKLVLYYCCLIKVVYSKRHYPWKRIIQGSYGLTVGSSLNNLSSGSLRKCLRFVEQCYISCIITTYVKWIAASLMLLAMTERSNKSVIAKERKRLRQSISNYFSIKACYIKPLGNFNEYLIIENG